MENSQDLIHAFASQGAKLRLDFFDAKALVLDRTAFAMASRLAGGGKILACGNGGSAADCQHFTGELVGRFLFERPSLPAIALTVDTSILTAVGNDYGYEEVFARQVRGLGQKSDVLVAFSTSGNSANLLRALEAARDRSMLTVGLTGLGGGRMAPLCDFLLDVPHQLTPLIQEIHGACVHLLCRLIDYDLFQNARWKKRGWDR
jgi:D-sedoheptulose 7-phosphate isomerase